MGMNVGPGGPYQPPKPAQPTPNNQTGQSSPANTSSQGTPLNPNPAVPAPPKAAGEILLSPLHAHQNVMTPSELSMFLRSILSLPKEIQQLLAMLSQGDDKHTAALLKQLLSENPALLINMTDLQAVLKKSVLNGENRLMQLIQSSQAGTGSSKLMGDLVGILGQFATRVAVSPAEALNTTLTLYLPWHPLADQQRLAMQFQQGGDGESGGESSGNAHLVLLIDTNTLGRFHILILPLQGLQVLLQIEHDAIFTAQREHFQEELSIHFVQNGLLKPEFAYKIRPNTAVATATDTTEHHDPALKSSTLHENNQSIVVQPGEGVPALVIQSAYIIARTLFTLDNQNGLDQQRQKLL